MASVTAVPEASRRQSVTENIKTSVRRIMIQGAPGCGKSTLSISASAKAGDTLPPKGRVVCDDVVVIQGDSEGMLGAYHTGFDCPNIYDMTPAGTFDEYMAQLRNDLKEVYTMVRDRAVKYIIVDLALLNRLLQLQVRPGSHADWGTVGYEGVNLYNLFRPFKGCFIIGNTQMKLAEAPGQTANAAATQTTLAVGGMVNTFIPDLVKGVGQQWRDHSSLTVSIERKRVREQGKARVENTFYIEANGKYEAKSRFGGLLDAALPGTMTLHSILQKGYGEAL